MLNDNAKLFTGVPRVIFGGHSEAAGAAGGQERGGAAGRPQAGSKVNTKKPELRKYDEFKKCID